VSDAERILLMLTVPPGLEETIVDWLLERREAPSFSNYPVYGHGADPRHMNPAEQVTGRRRRVQFQVELRRADLPALLDDLRRELPGADLHYWVLPVLVGGILN
jgi:hypothetical protein